MNKILTSFCVTFLLFFSINGEAGTASITKNKVSYYWDCYWEGTTDQDTVIDDISKEGDSIEVIGTSVTGMGILTANFHFKIIFESMLDELWMKKVYTRQNGRWSRMTSSDSKKCLSRVN